MTKAVRVHRVGGPEALVYESVEVAAPGPGEVRAPLLRRSHGPGLPDPPPCARARPWSWQFLHRYSLATRPPRNRSESHRAGIADRLICSLFAIQFGEHVEQFDRGENAMAA